MPTVILVRHGRTTANAAQVLAGRSRGVLLDDDGRTQVAATAARLAGLSLAAVTTSPLERCRDTAKVIARAQPEDGARKVGVDRGLVEVDYGDWTGQELKTLAKEPLWRTIQAHPAAVTFPGGEAMAAMSARAVGAVRRLDASVAASHGPDATWVAVSHGDVIKAVIADALGMHLDAFQRIVVDPASVSVIRYTELRPFVLMQNTREGDLGFLAPPPKQAKKRSRTSRRTTSDAVIGGGAGPGGQG